VPTKVFRKCSGEFSYKLNHNSVVPYIVIFSFKMMRFIILIVFVASGEFLHYLFFLFYLEICGKLVFVFGFSHCG